MAELPDRERRLLEMRFFRNMTQTEIAEELGISQMHVSRLLTRTLGQLREQLVQEAEQAHWADTETVGVTWDRELDPGELLAPSRS